mgnify:CR=1 FL=1
MKRFVVGTMLVMWLAMSPMQAEAGVSDWPVIGQVVRVTTCVVSDAGKLLGSLLSHLGSWGADVLRSVGQCSLKVVDTTTELVTDVVTFTVPTPDPEVPHE